MFLWNVFLVHPMTTQKRKWLRRRIRIRRQFRHLACLLDCFSHTPGLTTLQVLTTVRGSSLLNAVNKENNAQTPQITEAEWLATWSRNKRWTSECVRVCPSTIVHAKKLHLLVYFHRDTHLSYWRITEYYVNLMFIGPCIIAIPEE